MWEDSLWIKHVRVRRSSMSRRKDEMILNKQSSGMAGRKTDKRGSYRAAFYHRRI